VLTLVKHLSSCMSYQRAAVPSYCASTCNSTQNHVKRQRSACMYKDTSGLLQLHRTLQHHSECMPAQSSHLQLSSVSVDSGACTCLFTEQEGTSAALCQDDTVQQLCFSALRTPSTIAVLCCRLNINATSCNNVPVVHDQAKTQQLAQAALPTLLTTHHADGDRNLRVTQ
jgi:hypothetical protein